MSRHMHLPRPSHSRLDCESSPERGAKEMTDAVAIQHSSFVAGLPVEAAGILIVTGGTIEKVRGHSGHYLPSMQHLAKMCLMLQARGVPMNSVTIETFDGVEYTGLPGLLDAIENPPV